MAGRLVRAQILLEVEQHRALREQAQAQGKSISEVVREMLAGHFEARRRVETEVFISALDDIKEDGREFRVKNGGQLLDFDAVTAISQVREEQSDRNYGTIFDRS